MISLLLFYVFVTFCIGFKLTEERCIKAIDDDFYSRIIQFKVKNEIIKVNRNYGNVDKKIWRVKNVHGDYTYVKNIAEYVNMTNFP